jgi:hypothetical protein
MNMTSTTNGTASFFVPRTTDVFTDVAALLRVALRELEVAGHGACTLAGKVGDALQLAKGLAPGDTTKGTKDHSPSMPPPRGNDKDASPPVKDPVETARVALSVGTLDAMLAAVKALGLTCKTSSTGPMRKALQAVVDAAAPKADDKALPVPSAPPTLPQADKGKTTGLTAYRAAKAECEKLGLDTAGKLADLTARLDAHKAAPQAPAAVTLYVPDGKGGFRPATKDEILAAADAILAAPSRPLNPPTTHRSH